MNQSIHLAGLLERGVWAQLCGFPQAQAQLNEIHWGQEDETAEASSACCSAGGAAVARQRQQLTCNLLPLIRAALRAVRTPMKGTFCLIPRRKTYRIKMFRESQGIADNYVQTQFSQLTATAELLFGEVSLRNVFPGPHATNLFEVSTSCLNFQFTPSEEKK